VTPTRTSIRPGQVLRARTTPKAQGRPRRPERHWGERRRDHGYRPHQPRQRPVLWRVRAPSLTRASVSAAYAGFSEEHAPLRRTGSAAVAHAQHREGAAANAHGVAARSRVMGSHPPTHIDTTLLAGVRRCHSLAMAHIWSDCPPTPDESTPDDATPRDR
jgi:hypothetical protein